MSEIVFSRRILIYADESGYEPFIKWLDSLNNPVFERRIVRRINRLKQGNLGDYKNLGNGILELRMFFGAGYRVYIHPDGSDIIILLHGGSKKTQLKDIAKSRIYLQDYLEKK
ncbi:MAG: type II toxin-antitoxin system RelE/ParE family toxin [Calditrichota bacterium]